MKLLLTSGGVTNTSIAHALFGLVGKPPEETTVVVIPTAANVKMGDKSWLINDLVNLQKQNFKSIDIADISALDEEIWTRKFDAADVLFFEGGNSFHLMHWMNASGLTDKLRDYLKTKVYVGVSAGSMVAGPDLALRVLQALYEEDLDQTENKPGLGLVDFYVLPHFQSPFFKIRSEPVIRKAVEGMAKTVYALDDQTAIQVVDGRIEVVSEGEWFSV